METKSEDSIHKLRLKINETMNDNYSTTTPRNTTKSNNNMYNMSDNNNNNNTSNNYNSSNTNYTNNNLNNNNNSNNNSIHHQLSDDFDNELNKADDYNTAIRSTNSSPADLDNKVTKDDDINLDSNSADNLGADKESDANLNDSRANSPTANTSTNKENAKTNKYKNNILNYYFNNNNNPTGGNTTYRTSNNSTFDSRTPRYYNNLAKKMNNQPNLEMEYNARKTNPKYLDLDDELDKYGNDNAYLDNDDLMFDDLNLNNGKTNGGTKNYATSRAQQQPLGMNLNYLASPTAVNAAARRPPNMLPPLNNTTNNYALGNDGPDMDYMPEPSIRPSFRNRMSNIGEQTVSLNALNEPFDALQSRRRLLNELSSTNLRMPVRNDYAVQSSRRSGQYSIPMGDIIESRMTPINTGNDLVGAAMSETIVSNNVDDLIDVMAKRRIAIKRLENEMYRQHSRASNIIRPNYENSYKSGSQVNMRYIDPYNPYERQSRISANHSISDYDNPNLSRVSLNGGGLVPDPKTGNNLISNIEFPSETNREIYSTYLVDSIRPHYSARRLVNGVKNPQSRQPTSVYNNQPVILEANDLDLMDPLFGTNTDNLFSPNRNNYNRMNNFNRNYIPQSNSYEPSSNRFTSYDKANLPQYYDQTRPNRLVDDDLDYRPIKQQQPQPQQQLPKYEQKSLPKQLQQQNNPITNRKNDFQNDLDFDLVDDSLYTKREPSYTFLSQATKTNKNLGYQERKDPTPPFRNKPTMANPEASRKNKKPYELDDNNDNKKGYNNKNLVEPNDDYIKKDTKQNKAPQVPTRKSNETPVNSPPAKGTIRQRFPRLYDHQKLLWGAGTIVRFIIRVRNKAKASAQKNKNRSGSASIFRIQLLEIMTACHRVYLEPEGPIYTSLMEFIKNPNDMNALFDENSPIYDSCISTLCQSVEETVRHIADFMPKDGILGTTSKSALISLISEGNKFPDNYFWDIEKERLRFDENDKIRKIKKGRAILLLMSAMISRALITTLLIKPVKFRLMRGDLPANQRNNLKILATVLCYVVRNVNDNTNKIMDFPWEWQSSMFNDSKMKPIYNNPDVKKTIKECEKMFKDWTIEYIKRLDETAGIKRE